MTEYQGREVVAVAGSIDDFKANVRRMTLRVRRSAPGTRQREIDIASGLGIIVALFAAGILVFANLNHLPFGLLWPVLLLCALLVIGVGAWIANAAFGTEELETVVPIPRHVRAEHDELMASVHATAAEAVVEITAGFAKPFALSPWLSIPGWTIALDTTYESETAQAIVIACDLVGTSNGQTATRPVAIRHYIYGYRKNTPGYVDALRAQAVERLREARAKLVHELQIVEAV